MSMTQDAIRAEVTAMLSRANRHRRRRFNRYAGAGLLLGLICGVGLFATLFGWADSFGAVGGSLAIVGVALLSLVVGFVVACVAFLTSGFADDKEVERLADRFRETFPRQGRAFDKALAVLKTAQTKSEVEKDLIEVLEDVTFEGAPALLGDFEPAGGAGPESNGPEPPSGYVPLKPYGASDDAGPPGKNH